jgi:hypothetical protein
MEKTLIGFIAVASSKNIDPIQSIKLNISKTFDMKIRSRLRAASRQLQEFYCQKRAKERRERNVKLRTINQPQM